MKPCKGPNVPLLDVAGTWLGMWSCRGRGQVVKPGSDGVFVGDARGEAGG